MNNELFKITHEIKNPLTVMKGYISLMDGNKEKYDKYIPLLSKSIDHAISILDDFSSLGKMNMKFEIMDVNCLIEDIIESYKDIFKSRNINFIYESKDKEIFIKGDYKRLNEVLINIIKNAEESLTNINPCISISLKSFRKKVIICVKDNGIGMDMETMDKITTPFFTTKNYGTGLGTYLSKKIVDAHKGKLIYESTKGVGTSVYIKLDQYDLV